MLRPGLPFPLLARTGLSGLVAALLWAAPAPATTGAEAPPVVTPPPVPTAPLGVATLQPDGSALPPADAPPTVRRAINAANRIRTKPYIWGGGHRRFRARGYDCSGAVSYALHAAGLLAFPMTSGYLARLWGAPGIGQWITVYANRSHTYAVIAGLRWDTSAIGEPLRSGSGPRWRMTQRSPSGYAARYFVGL